MPNDLELLVNGENRRVDSPPETPLLAVLREELELTGAKIGCGEGECGACTVLVDGEVARSCITPIGSVAGRSILTVEGLEQNGQLHPVQQAFLDAQAFQCAYCTSGMILASVALLQKNPQPTYDETVSFMQGNLCRCGAYRRIFHAIQLAAAAGREGKR